MEEDPLELNLETELKCLLEELSLEVHEKSWDVDDYFVREAKRKIQRENGVKRVRGYMRGFIQELIEIGSNNTILKKKMYALLARSKEWK